MPQSDERATFKAFLEESGVTQQAIADAVNALGGDKRGKPIDRRRVWNYTTKTLLPEWFIERLNQAFPLWRQGSAGTFLIPAGNGEINEANIEIPNDPAWDLLRTFPSAWSFDLPVQLELPVLPPVNDPTFLIALRKLLDSPENARSRKKAMSLLGRLPLQPIVDNVYAPVFRIGDALLLLPGIPAKEGCLFLIARDNYPLECHYAILDYVEEEPYWVLYKGGVIHFGLATAIAAVAALLPQQSASKVDGIYDPEGINIRRYANWPYKKTT